MKTTLIQLEQTDDFLSIKDKMQWNPSGRILLVVPHNNKSIHRRLDLVLLQRAAKKSGTQIAISTSQKPLKRLANLAGVNVYSTVLAAQKQEWPDQSPELLNRNAFHQNKVCQIGKFLTDKQPIKVLPNWQKILFFTIGVLAPVAIILLLTPRATVSFIPNTTVMEMTLDFSASPDYSSSVLEGRIQAVIRSINLSLTDSVATSGQASIPDHFAHGFVRITNLSDKIQLLPANCRIYSNVADLQFQIVNPVVIPPGKGEFVDVPITSMVAGAVGNLPPLSINSISEPYSSYLEITNLVSTSGGTDITVNAVSDRDSQLLTDQVVQKLKSEALAQIENSSSSAIVNVPDSLEIVNQTYETNLGIGDPGDQLTMEMAATFTYLMIDKDNLEKLATAFGDISIPTGYQKVPGTLQVESPVIKEFNYRDRVVYGQIGINQSIRKTVDIARVVSAILGKSIKEAREIIETNLDLTRPPQILLSPPFWLWMPLIPSQIVVEPPGYL